jgi:hypothetical protein
VEVAEAWEVEVEAEEAVFFFHQHAHQMY